MINKKKNKKSSQIAPKVALLGIYLINFKYDEDKSIADRKDILNVLTYSVDIEYKINVPQERIEITINFLLEIQEREVMTISCKSEYHCLDVVKFIDNKTKRFSDIRFENFLAEKSFSHTRGIHAYLVKDTYLKDFLLPLKTPIIPENEVTQLKTAYR